MALFARAFRLSRRPTVDTTYRWMAATAGGGSPDPDNCAVVAPSKVELPPPQLPGGISLVEPSDSSPEICAVAAPTKVELPPPQGQSVVDDIKHRFITVSDTHPAGMKSPVSSLLTSESMEFSVSHGTFKPLLCKHNKAMSFSSASRVVGKFPAKVIKPVAPRSIRPGSLPPVYQLNFTSEEDIRAEIWADPIKYLSKYPPFCDVPGNGLYASKPIPEEHFRVLQRSLVQLVHENKVRGIDITPSLYLDNLCISTTYGTFGLKKLEDYTYTSASSTFSGYKAAGHVLERLLSTLYWNGLLNDVSADVRNYYTLLDSNDIKDDLNLYNAALLCREGRAGLSVKLDILFRNEIWEMGFTKGEKRNLVDTFYCNMPEQYLGQALGHFPTDRLHDNFKEWRKYSSDLGALMSTLRQPYQWHEDPNAISTCRKVTGKWLTLLNRHGVLHPKGMRWESIDQLHSWIPEYLPDAQKEIWELDQNYSKKLWQWLDMKSFFPKEG